MTQYKLVFLDIDGTILRPDDTIEDSTKSAISQLQRKGIEVVLATGRPLHEITNIGETLQINSFIAYNGAYAIHSGKEILRETMNPSDVADFLHIAKENHHDMVFYSDKKNLLINVESDIVKRFIKTFHLKKNDLFNETDKDQILGITIITDQENAATHYQHFQDIHFSQVNVEGVNHCYDVIRDHVNKGSAVKKFIETLGYPAESAIAFGDGMNDKEMLSFVGDGFAMGNAHPELAAYAKHVTTDVQNAGVFNGLKSLGLVE